MAKLEQLDNVAISPADYQAPTEQLEATRFVLTRVHFLLAGLAVLCLLFIAFVTLARSVQVSAITPQLKTIGKASVVSNLAGVNKSIKYQPLSADINVSGLLKLPIGNRILMLPGTQTATVSAEGFASVEQAITINADRHQQFEIVLTRLPGKLDVQLLDAKQQTIDSSAQVLINGEPLANLPGLIEDVPAGEHEFTVDAPLYRPASQSLLIEGKNKTQALSLVLQPAWAEYTIDSKPQGAEVLVDGESAGKTPATLKIEEGLRDITLNALGYKAHKQEVAVVAEQDITMPSVELVPADGILALQSEPVDAAIILNGEFRGTTPLSLTMAPNQPHRLQLYKAGYQLVEQELSLTPDQKIEKNWPLQQDLVAVNISVSPKDAVVYVDGNKRGQGNQVLNLTTLPHTISVRKAGYVTQNNDIIPTKRSKQIISVNLLTKEQHYWAQLPDNYTNAAEHSLKLFKAPGRVIMGSSRREAGRRANEPQYTVELSKPFYVALHETTNKQFRKFKKSHNAGNYKKKSLDANKAPAVNISWQEAALYCNWLSKREKLNPFYQTKSGFVSGMNPNANGYRLLTEAEWAWLARNKDNDVLLYPWGNTDSIKKDQRVGNYADQQAADLVAFTVDGYDDGYRGSAPVGRYPANHRGLFDMGGNAAEWVNDWYSAQGNKELRGVNALKDPLGPDIGEFHTVRGASWARGYLPQLRLAYRDFGAKAKHDIGFRIARYAGLTKGSPK